jgi:phosphoglycolate phosphatase-like HAD superfamily hydrolase/tetratricopeptide (TPR) repeat protein
VWVATGLALLINLVTDSVPSSWHDWPPYPWIVVSGTLVLSTVAASIAAAIQRRSAADSTGPESATALRVKIAENEGVVATQAIGEQRSAGNDYYEQHFHGEIPDAPRRPREPTSIKHNLSSRSVFMGRQQEIARCFQGLRSNFTIIAFEGLGGMGKTALAREVAWRIVTNEVADRLQFTSVAWCGDASGTLTLDKLLDTVAQVLDYPYVKALEMPDKEETLLEHLRDNCCLIVVDAFDTLVDDAIREFLTKIPSNSTKVLVTSRFRFPADAWSVKVGKLDRETSIQLVRSETLRLGIQHLGNDNSILSDLYDTTGGNPLAIRLSAGQMRDEGTPLTEVLATLKCAGDKDLFSTIYDRVWSEMLSPLDPDGEASRMVLAAIASHPGAATRDALQAAVDLDHQRLRTCIRKLVRISLIDSELSSESIVRFDMHALTRSFVRREIESVSPGKSRLEDKLVDFYLAYAVAHSGTYADETNIHALEAERLNLLAFAAMAFERARRISDRKYWGQVIQYADVLAPFLWGRGYWRDRLKLCERALVAAAELADQFAAARQHILIGRVQLWLGNVKRAEQSLQSTHSMLQPVNPPSPEYLAARRLQAQIESAVGNAGKAEDALKELLTVAPITVDDDGRAATLVELGVAATRRNNFNEAKERFEEALKLDEKMGTVEGSAISLSHLGNALYELRDYARAAQVFERGLVLGQRVDRRSTIGRCQFGMAKVAAVRQDWLPARQFAVEAEDSFLRLGMKQMAEEAKLIAISVPRVVLDEQPSKDLVDSMPFSPAALILDCDDTLISTSKTRWSVLMKTAADFGEVLDETTIRASWGKPFNELIKTIVPGVDPDVFVPAYRIAMQTQKPQPTIGAVAFLALMHQRGVPMEVVTSSSRDLIIQDLDALGLTGFFVNIYGYEETAYHKPDPRILEIPIADLARRGYGTDDIVYIGDSVRDYQVARGHELHFVAVLSGLDSRSDFIDAGLAGECIINSFNALLDRL